MLNSLYLNLNECSMNAVSKAARCPNMINNDADVDKNILYHDFKHKINNMPSVTYRHHVTPTAYELGIDGFGADQTHSGDIARNSQRLLREWFCASTTG